MLSSPVDTFFGGGQAQAGQDMYNTMNRGLQGLNIVGQGMNYLSPFMSREAGQYQAYMNALNQAQNPMQLYNQFASSYKMSPEAQAQIQQGQKAASGAAAASGMLGSGAEQTAAANLAQSVRSQDFDKYMGNMFNIRNQYLGGLQGMQREGFQAGLTGAQLTAQEAEQQAQLQQRYYEDMANAQGRQDIGGAGGWSNLLGTGIGIAANYFGL